jgi:hypothetical protein
MCMQAWAAGMGDRCCRGRHLARTRAQAANGRGLTGRPAVAQRVLAVASYPTHPYTAAAAGRARNTARARRWRGDRWGWPGHGGASSRLPGRGQARRDAAETDVVVLCGARDPPGFGAFRRREVVVVRHLGWCVSLQRFHFRQRTTATGAWRVLVSRG